MGEAQSGVGHNEALTPAQKIVEDNRFELMKLVEFVDDFVRKEYIDYGETAKGDWPVAMKPSTKQLKMLINLFRDRGYEVHQTFSNVQFVVKVLKRLE